MRCKRGELAVIVYDEKGCKENIGKLVTVLDDWNCREGEWRIESQSALVALGTHDGMYYRLNPGDEAWIPDRFLRPIRDPGDDAVDEMIQLLGKPESIPA